MDELLSWETVTPTVLVVCTFPAIPNTKAAMTAARITTMATMRITPMTGDTASSSKLNFFIIHLDVRCTAFL